MGKKFDSERDEFSDEERFVLGLLWDVWNHKSKPFDAFQTLTKTIEEAVGEPVGEPAA